MLVMIAISIAITKTVQMTLDDKLLTAVDRAAKRARTTRSAFTRDALRAALAKKRVEDLEARHQEAYRRHPIRAGELDGWQDEQVWPEP
jgi:predicted transcriptional regulator